MTEKAKSTGTPKFPIRLSLADRQMLTTITEHHALDSGSDMIRRLIRQEWRRVQEGDRYTAPAPAAPVIHEEAEDLD